MKETIAYLSSLTVAGWCFNSYSMGLASIASIVAFGLLHLVFGFSAPRPIVKKKGA